MIRSKLRGLREAVRDLRLVGLSRPRKQRLTRKMARYVMKSSRLRLTQQTDVSGAQFAPRKQRGDEKDKKKLLQGFRRNMRIRFEGVNAIVYVSSGIWGQRARQQQEGFTEAVRTVVAEEKARIKRRRRNKGPSGTPGEMATRKQARRLKELGWKKSQKWIMETYSRNLAGFLIRKEEGRAPKTFWEIVVPAREFLGTSKQDLAVLRKTVADELKRAN